MQLAYFKNYDFFLFYRGYWNTSVELPMDMVCDQCILQWTYTAGNDWGTCDNGTEALGCGPQVCNLILGYIQII